MQLIGFDNDKYVRMQSEKIRERIDFFGGKLYLEFGGKLFDDYHASRVLPGFQPDSKVRMLMEMKDGLPAGQQGAHAHGDEGRCGNRHRHLGGRH